MDVRRWALQVCFGSALLASCAHRGKGTASALPETEEVEVASSKATQVELLDAGAEPRRAVRYHLPAEGSWTSVVDYKMSQEVVLGDMPERASIQPTVRIELRTAVVPAEHKGRIQLRQTVGGAELVPEPGMSPELLDKIRQVRIPAMPGFAVTTESSTRGLLVHSDVEDALGSMPPKARAIMQNFAQSMRSPLVTFPREPIGIGAKWKVSTPMNTPLLKATPRIVQTLTELEGDKGTLELSGGMDIPTQDIQIPSEEGMSARIESAKTQFGGSTRFDLSSPTTTSEFRMEIAMQMVITDGKNATPARNVTRIRLKGYPRR